jgi:hypothetical protein
MLRIVYFVFLILLVIPCASLAESKIIFAEHKYVMGDNDSKNDARRMCFIEAKRRVLEKAGTYIESRTEVKDFRLTKDEISAYAAALLKVDTVNEEWKFIGENMAILISVKAEVDINSVEKQLAKIKQDISVQKEIKDQQSRLQELEHKFIKLQKQLTTAGSLESLSLRKKRNILFKEIGKTEERYKYVINKLKDRRVASVEQARLILNYIEIDMTPEEVEYILGKQDEKAVSKAKARKGRIYRMSYGRFLIHFSHSTLVDNIKYKLNNLLEVRLKYLGYNILRDGMDFSKMGIHYLPYEMRDEAISEIKKYVLGQ